MEADILPPSLVRGAVDRLENSPEFILRKTGQGFLPTSARIFQEAVCTQIHNAFGPKEADKFSHRP